MDQLNGSNVIEVFYQSGKDQRLSQMYSTLLFKPSGEVILVDPERQKPPLIKLNKSPVSWQVQKIKEDSVETSDTSNPEFLFEPARVTEFGH